MVEAEREPREERSNRSKEFESPLEAWRSTDPEDFCPAKLDGIRRAGDRTAWVLHRRWPSALSGDPAAAIAVAIDILKAQGPTTFPVDLAMSRVLLGAIGGNPASALVMAHGLALLSRETGSRHLLDRAGLWARRLPTARARPPAR